MTSFTSLEDEGGEDSTRLSRFLDTALDRVVNTFLQAGVDLPQRRYWTFATPSHDCEQLTISFNQLYHGTPGDDAGSPTRCDGPMSVSLNIEIVRCIPTVSPRGNRAPTPEQIQEGSRHLAVDAMMLLMSAEQIDSFDPYGGPGLGVIATVAAGEPQGGFQATGMTIDVVLP